MKPRPLNPQDRRARDAELVRAASSGNEQARRDLADRVLDRIRTSVRYLCVHHPEEADFVQLCLVEVLRSVHSFRGDSRLETWVDRISLRTTLRHLAGGNDVVFTPDGPRGPRYTVQPGMALVACRSGLPVVPVGVGMSRKKVFASWDRFQLPLPFGRIHIHFGELLRFGREDDLEQVREQIRVSLVAATDAADRALGVTSP